MFYNFRTRSDCLCASRLPSSISRPASPISPSAQVYYAINFQGLVMFASNHTRRRTAIAFCLCALSLGGLSACGQTGPLVYPDDNGAATPQQSAPQRQPSASE